MRRVCLIVLMLAVSCSGDGSSQSVTSTIPNPSAKEDATAGAPSVVVALRHGGDGNLASSAAGPFDEDPTTDRWHESRVVRLDLPVLDVVAATHADGSVYIVDGTTGEAKTRFTDAPTALVFTTGPNGVDLLTALDDHAPHGRPAVLPGGLVAYVTTAGELAIRGLAGEIRRLDLGALPDGDVLADDRGRLLVLTGPTERYPHAILGDAVEASGFAIYNPAEPDSVVRVEIDTPAVIEGRRALWADFDGDGALEVQVTVSDSEGGARLIVYEETGEIAFEGSPIGRGNRWRHQIAFGQFGGRQLGVEVVTPHIGGIVTFNEYRGEEIANVARVSRYTSHGIGSRELEGAVALDVDGDGDLELLLPTQDRRTLVAIGVTDGEAGVEWMSAVDSPITSNIAVGMRNGVQTIAVGTADGTVYFWSALR